MGLFNFIYKLTNILSNKKKLKVFIIIAIVIVIVFAWSLGCFAVEPTPTDQNSLMNYQLQLQRAMVDYVTFLYKFNNINQSQFNTFIAYLRAQNVYVTTSINDSAKFIVYFYNNNQPGTNNFPNTFTTEGTWELGVLDGGQVSGTAFPCMLSEFTGMVSVVYLNDQLSVQRNPSPVSSTTFWLPDGCYLVRSTAIDELLETVNAYSELPTTYNTRDSELQALTRAGFQNQVNAINNATSAINDVNSSVEDVNQSVMDMINTIVDPYVNVSQQQLPQSNVQDSTEEGLDNIFIIIKNAFTGTPQSVSFPVPFTDKSFTIEPGFTENSMKKGGLNAMVSVIHLYWYYRIYSFIFLKYVELLEKLKEGEFEETVGNIKKEVL